MAPRVSCAQRRLFYLPQANRKYFCPSPTCWHSHYDTWDGLERHIRTSISPRSRGTHNYLRRVLRQNSCPICGLLLSNPVQVFQHLTEDHDWSALSREPFPLAPPSPVDPSEQPPSPSRQTEEGSPDSSIMDRSRDPSVEDGSHDSRESYSPPTIATPPIPTIAAPPIDSIYRRTLSDRRFNLTSGLVEELKGGQVDEPEEGFYEWSGREAWIGDSRVSAETVRIAIASLESGFGGRILGGNDEDYMAESIFQVPGWYKKVRGPELT
ncbi:hypothetical protein MMC28_011336 [Mycoblastus sanguinarius]|nr:hypothetical protein [Mycoblastus sanguinarius]